MDNDALPDHLDIGRQFDPTPNTQAEDKEAFKARSYLRALLRESSYLTDSIARKWTRYTVCGSFRAHERKLKDRQHNTLLEERFDKWYKDARWKLSVLRRANEEDPICLRKVLLEAYGRTGKRRRLLLQPLLLESARKQSSRVAAEKNSKDKISSEGRGKGRTQDMVDYHEERESNETSPVDIPNQRNTKFEPQLLPPQLAALLQSQITSAPPDLTRVNPRRLEANVPELNTWLRPMPQKRVKNIHQKHYAELLSRALPPLPLDEWERLKAIASGEVKVETSKPRRAKCLSTIGDGFPTLGALDLVVRYGKVPRKVTLSQQSGSSERTLRRLYAKVFSQCPAMRFNEEKNEWIVTWGEQALLEKLRTGKT